MQISSPTFRILESVMRNGESEGAYTVMLGA